MRTKKNETYITDKEIRSIIRSINKVKISSSHDKSLFIPTPFGIVNVNYNRKKIYGSTKGIEWITALLKTYGCEI